MAARILHVATNVAHDDDRSHPTGLWLSDAGGRGPAPVPDALGVLAAERSDHEVST